jgi:PiT family inorganic phosphate transporter
MEVIEAISGFVTAHPFISATIFLALAFDFVNGFHDSANAIATVVATRVLTPLQAVLMAGFFNFVGPFLFSLAVASTIGKGILQTDAFDAGVLPHVVFAALVGGILWDLITWYWGLPTSSSHAIVGGLMGAGIAAAGTAGVQLPTAAEWIRIAEFIGLGAIAGVGLGGLLWLVSRFRIPDGLLRPMGYIGALATLILYAFMTELPSAEEPKKFVEWVFTGLTTSFIGGMAGALIWVVTQHRMPGSLVLKTAPFGAALMLILAVLEKWLVLGGITKTVLFMVVSPFVGFFAGFLLASIVAWWVRKTERSIVSHWSRRLQLVSSGFYALTHGTNDAQKTMGVIGVLLVAAGTLAVDDGASSMHVPGWVIFSSAGAMGLGTLFGGWRIVKTMASKITHLSPAQGFAAETGGGVVLAAMAHAGIPVSTTHAISSSIMGVGATRRASAVRWGVGRRIVGAWILTIPASAVVSYLTYLVLALFF